MNGESVDKAVTLLNQKLMKKLNIQYESAYNLRTKRSEKFTIAQAYNRLTIFVNEKGSICHACHPNGVFIAVKSPKHLHDLAHKEYAITYFLNKMREVMGGNV